MISAAGDTSAALKRRFADVIREMLSQTIGWEGAGLQGVQASVDRSPGGVLIRLHLQGRSSQPSGGGISQTDELVSSRIYPQAGGRKVIILVTRDAQCVRSDCALQL